MPETKLDILCDAAYFSTFTSWKEIIKYLIHVHGEVSVKDIYNLTKRYNRKWVVQGKYGGRTVKNTIYSACSTATKQKQLVAVKKNSISYYNLP